MNHHVSDASSDILTEGVGPTRASIFSWVDSQYLLDKEVVEFPYDGSGTAEDPFIVEYIPNDRRNPLNFSTTRKWRYTVITAFLTLSVSFSSSAYSGGIKQIITDFQVSEEIAILGITLFVLGFAVGPLFWAPLSELYGRQPIFFITFALFTAFNGAAVGSTSIATLIVLRCLAGLSGASALTNSGGVIGDLFPAAQRGLALSIFAAAPFMGPVFGPVVGGFVGQSTGWKWIQGVMAIFSGVLWILNFLLVPETYTPFLLTCRAEALSKYKGKSYRTRIEVSQGKTALRHALKTALSRPWALLFLEPIVLLLSLYLSIVYGILYSFFAAFPIIFQEEKCWSQGIGGLPFIGIAIGMLFAVIYNIWDNRRFSAVEKAALAKGERGAPPEARLPPSILGSFCIPVGLFGFAWTIYPSIHWIVCLLFTIPFGFGVVLIFLGIFNYLIDAYTIYAASVLAANSVLRSSFGAGFPLFTPAMFHTLGIHWATSIPAFLSLICIIFPILFYYYGPKIRRGCKYAKESDDFMDKIKGRSAAQAEAGGAERPQECENQRSSCGGSEIEKTESRHSEAKIQGSEGGKLEV